MKTVTEAQTQHAVIEYLAAKRYFYLRMNTGALAAEHNGKKRFVRFGTPGCADVLALVRINECSTCGPIILPLWIECKSPTGKQSDAQKEFQEYVESHGHLYILIRDVNEVIHFIDGIY